MPTGQSICRCDFSCCLFISGFKATPPENPRTSLRKLLGCEVLWTPTRCKLVVFGQEMGVFGNAGFCRCWLLTNLEMIPMRRASISVGFKPTHISATRAFLLYHAGWTTVVDMTVNDRWHDYKSISQTKKNDLLKQFLILSSLLCPGC